MWNSKGFKVYGYYLHPRSLLFNSDLTVISLNNYSWFHHEKKSIHPSIHILQLFHFSVAAGLEPIHRPTTCRQPFKGIMQVTMLMLTLTRMSNLEWPHIWTVAGSWSTQRKHTHGKAMAGLQLWTFKPVVFCIFGGRCTIINFVFASFI